MTALLTAIPAWHGVLLGVLGMFGLLLLLWEVFWSQPGSTREHQGEALDRALGIMDTLLQLVHTALTGWRGPR